MSAENWLNDEQFDFDLNASRTSVDEVEEDDEFKMMVATFSCFLSKKVKVCPCGEGNIKMLD